MRGSDLTPVFRLIATDLDGTLLRDDGTVSARTRAALERVRAAGITVVLVTARPPRTLRVMARDAGVTGLAVCCNGAILYDLAADAIMEHTALSATVAQRLIAALRAAAPDICFAVEQGLVYGQERRYAALSPPGEPAVPVHDDALALCATGITKLIVRHPTHPLDELLRLTREIAGEAASVTHSGAPFVEVAAAGVTKAWALATLCARLAIGPAQVMAFGDMPNDLPLLAWARHSVAVANAHPDVLAAAHEVTLSNNADGVALVLERLVNGK